MPGAVPRTPSPQRIPTPTRISTLEHRNARPSKRIRRSVSASDDTAMWDDDDDDEMELDNDNSGENQQHEEEDDGGYLGGGGNELPDADIDAEDESSDEEEDLAFEDIKEEKMEFQPGAIRRMTLVNFMTYKETTINFGPSLNMVIGPNGTGKSTIVCAICLGLGWSPVVLGRVKDIGEFIREGQKRGSIEIELQKKPEDAKNPVIYRSLLKEGNVSSFKLNGAQSTTTKVIKFCKSYNIQIDNLCQFLPQDKVAEFAKITPPDRLKETLRAAAPPEMLENHEKLKELGKKSAELEGRCEHHSKELERLQNRQALDQAQVDRLKARKATIAELELYEKARPIVLYNISQKKAKDAKNQHKEAENAYRNMKAEAAPTLELPERKKAYLRKVKEAMSARSAAVNEKKRQLDRIKQQITDLADQITSLDGSMSAETSLQQTRTKDMAKLKEIIEKCAKKLEGGRPSADMTELNERHKAIRQELREIDNEIVQLKDDRRKLQDHIRVLEGQKTHKQTQLQDLESAQGQRMEVLKRVNGDAAKLWEYLQNHLGEFEKQVFPPAILNCTVTDPRVIDVAEHIISGVAQAFVCQSRADYDKLFFLVFNKQKSPIAHLRLRNIQIKIFEDTLQDQPEPPATRQQLRTIGVDGYLIDFIDGPEPMLNMLCQTAQIHQLPIAIQPLSEQNLDAVRRYNFSCWTSGREVVQVARRYGNSSERFTVAKNAKNFRQQGVDSGRQNVLTREINEKIDEIAEVTKEVEKMAPKLRDLQGRRSEASTTKTGIEKERSDKQKARDDYDKLQGQKEAKEAELAGLKQSFSQFQTRMADMELNIHKLTCKKAEKSMEFSTLVSELVESHHAHVQANLCHIEASSDVKILEGRVARIKQDLAAKEAEVSDLRNQHIQLKGECQRCLDIVRERLAADDEEEKAKLKEIADQCTEMSIIENKISELEAKLELTNQSDEGVLQRYDERQKQIKTHSKHLDRYKSELGATRSELDRILKDWEPKLEKLCRRISEAFGKSFGKINCSGQVQVRKVENDFDKWAIDILVKFRENENLQVLDSHRQSGGERAVTTVFYLMALQSLARSPFRVVDEINQGMDPRNERVVHSRLVHIACKKHTSQYFLVTPKLLSDLRYHNRMVVHCVYSGEVQEGLVMNVKKYLSSARKMKKNALKQRAVEAH